MNDKVKIILWKTLIWGMAGIIFGGSFVAFHDILPLYTGEYWYSAIFAAGISGTVTAAYFGAIKEAFLGSVIGLFLAVLFLMYWGAYEIKNPEVFLLTTFICAFFAGRFFPKATILRDKPFAQAISGLLSGLIAGFALSFFHEKLAIEGHYYFFLALVGVSFVGLCYVVVSGLIISQCREWMTNLFSAPIVSATCATAAGWGILLMTNVDPEITQAIDHISDGAMGGFIGGAMGGFALTVLGIKDKNNYHV